jgi:pilus assembly protein Flp/PilA
MGKTKENFAQDESGGTAIEYGLVAGGTSIAIIVGLTKLGSALNAKLALLLQALQ